MSDQPGKLVFHPFTDPVAFPPKDFKGDPEIGRAYYYCTTKGCDKLWGVRWNEAEPPRGLLNFTEYKTFAIGKLCPGCTKLEARLTAWEKQCEKKKKSAKGDFGGTTNAKTKSGKDEEIVNDSHTMANAQEDELWEIIDRREGNEPWLLL